MQPIQEERGDTGKPAKQTSRKGYPQDEMSNQGAGEMDTAAGILMHQSGAVVSLPAERPECFPGFILFYKVTNECADAQVLVLCSGAERPAMVVSHDRDSSERNRMRSSG